MHSHNISGWHWQCNERFAVKNPNCRRKCFGFQTNFNGSTCRRRSSGNFNVRCANKFTEAEKVEYSWNFYNCLLRHHEHFCKIVDTEKSSQTKLHGLAKLVQRKFVWTGIGLHELCDKLYQVSTSKDTFRQLVNNKTAIEYIYPK